jgi:hypothetical protein
MSSPCCIVGPSCHPELPPWAILGLVFSAPLLSSPLLSPRHSSPSSALLFSPILSKLFTQATSYYVLSSPFFEKCFLLPELAAASMQVSPCYEELNKRVLASWPVAEEKLWVSNSFCMPASLTLPH